MSGPSAPLPQPICRGCNKKPAELEEYSDPNIIGDMTPDEYVRAEEGTYNSATGGFLCTPCYIDAGCPSLPSPHRWIAP